MVQIGQELVQIIYESLQREKGKKKHQTSYEAIGTKENLPSTEELIRNYGYRWDYEECYKSRSLSDFDKTVQKACNLAKESFDKDDERSWLKILTCLDRLAESVHKLLTEEERRRPDKYAQLF